MDYTHLIWLLLECRPMQSRVTSEGSSEFSLLYFVGVDSDSYVVLQGFIFHKQTSGLYLCYYTLTMSFWLPHRGYQINFPAL